MCKESIILFTYDNSYFNLVILLVFFCKKRQRKDNTTNLEFTNPTFDKEGTFD